MGIFSQNPELEGDFFDNKNGLYHEQNLLKKLALRDGFWHSLVFTTSWQKDGDTAIEAVLSTLQRYQYKVVSVDVQPLDITEDRIRGMVHIVYR